VSALTTQAAVVIYINMKGAPMADDITADIPRDIRANIAKLDERLDAIAGDLAVLKSDGASLKMDMGLIKDQGTYVTVRLEYLSRSVTDIAKLIAPTPA
jgi:hypothetical protein